MLSNRLFAFILIALSFEALFVLQKWRHPIFHFLLPSYFLLSAIKTYLWSSNPIPVYLVGFSCFKPPSACEVPFSTFVKHASMIESFEDESVEFMAKTLTSSGLGQETYLPPALHCIPPETHHRESIKEAQMVLFPVMDDLLSKTKLSPQDIDILIVNCSGFCPSPSLSSIIINKYSLRSDIKSYNLSGMGCSAGAIGVDLARNLLKTYKNSNAIVLSTEILSSGWYSGHEKPKLLLNCVFRMGSAGILLTNKKDAKNKSKYKVLHSLRTQRASDDKAYFAAFREEDSSGKLGVTFKKDLLQAVGETLRSHVTILGSEILPLSEKIRYAVSIIGKKIIKSGEIYMPSFKSVVQHFCLPTSGRPLIKEVAKGLRLNARDMEPALMTLHRFGNQSSSSWWYELGYMEGKGRVKKGDKVWVLGLGTGLKCCSLVLECLRPILDGAERSPWSDCIQRYPVVVVDKHSTW
ncbi:ECERIFERUM 60, 3-ketoacyl-CoA synthase 5 [Hibiscus trionum]|uniref:3-ketoacyl-CoA synthase n=1 Tax=Hibiscus trionum TaxID=183268 RepID=A0A9W7JI32_HIBTR|nr:ECERIFERUM 60, 3-ketoacyl-CoA synthase 5 [Hibiscus trionum]